MGGFDQLRPESPEIARAIPSRAPPLNRESSQTTYTLPVEASAEIEGSGPPVRTTWPVFGSTTPTFCTSLTVIGGSGQVAPLSVERSTAICAAVLLPLIAVRTSMALSRVPSGSAATTLPIVCAFAPGS